MATTPNMSLILPTVSVTLGPTWATQLNSALNIVDSHDHTSGSGVPIPTDGISIDADLTFGGYNATNLKSTRYSAQGSPLGTVNDVGCLYVSGVDLYYNDGNGNQIQLTASGALNASSIGGIGGDYTTSSASVSYSDSTKRYVFWQDTNQSAEMDVGTILLRKTTASSAAITIQAASGLSSGYTLTLPTAAPGSTVPVQVDSSGNLSFSSSLSSLTLSSLTASTVPYLGASKEFLSSAVTPTELGYLSGTTGPGVVSVAAITVFTSSGTWTKSTLSPKFIRVTVVGPGGGGGGCAAPGASAAASGSGGGGGEWGQKIILAASLGATETVTVGSGGSGGTAGNNNGSDGSSASSFGSHISAAPGSGGSGGAATTGSNISAGGAGGTGGSGGSVYVKGESGGVGRVLGGSLLFTNNGGSSKMGFGPVSSGTGTGITGQSYGAGGSGANQSSGNPAQAGGDGADGVVIVEEFY